MAGELTNFQNEVEAKAKYDIDQKRSKEEIDNYDGSSVVDGYKATVAEMLRGSTELNDEAKKQALSELELRAQEAKSKIESMKRAASEKLVTQANNFADRIATAMMEQRKAEAEKPQGVRKMVDGVDVQFVNIASVPKVRSASNRDMQVVLVEMIKTIYVEQGKKAAEAKVAELKNGGLNNGNFETQFGKVREESGIDASNIHLNVLNGRIMGNLYLANEVFKGDESNLVAYKKYLADQRKGVETEYKDGGDTPENNQKCYLIIQGIQTPSEWVNSNGKNSKDISAKTAKELGIPVEDLENATKTARAIAKQARENARDIHDYVAQYKDESGKALIEEKIATGKKLSEVISTMKTEPNKVHPSILDEMAAAVALLDEAMRLGSEKISSENYVARNETSRAGGRASADYMDTTVGAPTSSAPKIADTYNEKEKVATEKRDAATKAMLEAEEKDKADGQRKKVVRESLLDAKTSLGALMVDEEAKNIVSEIEALLATVDNNQDVAKLESEAASLLSKAKAVSEKKVAKKEKTSTSAETPVVPSGDKPKATPSSGPADQKKPDAGNGNAPVAAKGSGDDSDASSDKKDGDAKKTPDLTQEEKDTIARNTDAYNQFLDTDSTKERGTAAVESGDVNARSAVGRAIDLAKANAFQNRGSFEFAVKRGVASAIAGFKGNLNLSRDGVTVSVNNGNISISFSKNVPSWVKEKSAEYQAAWGVSPSAQPLVDREPVQRQPDTAVASAPNAAPIQTGRTEEEKTNSAPVAQNDATVRAALNNRTFADKNAIKVAVGNIRLPKGNNRIIVSNISDTSGNHYNVSATATGEIVVAKLASDTSDLKTEDQSRDKGEKNGRYRTA